MCPSGLQPCHEATELAPDEVGQLQLCRPETYSVQEIIDLLDNQPLLQRTRALVLSARTVSPRAAVLVLDALPRLETLHIRDIGHWSVADWAYNVATAAHPWHGGHPATAEWPTIAGIGELLQEIPQLNEVHLHNAWGIGDLEFLGHLAAISSKLVSLEIPDSHRVAPRLRHTSAHGLRWVGYTGTIQLTQFTNLRMLDLSCVKTPIAAYSDQGPQLNADSVRHIGCVTSLQALNLAGNVALHADSLTPISGLTGLSSLDLTRVALGLNPMTMLCELQRLQRLILAHTGVNDAIVLSTLTKLPQLMHVDFSGCAVGPSALVQLVGSCPNLEQLNIAGVPDISPQTVAQLLDLRPQLQVMDKEQSPFSRKELPPMQPTSLWKVVHAWLQLWCAWTNGMSRMSLLLATLLGAELLHASALGIPRTYGYIFAGIVGLASVERKMRTRA